MSPSPTSSPVYFIYPCFSSLFQSFLCIIFTHNPLSLPNNLRPFVFRNWSLQCFPFVLAGRTSGVLMTVVAPNSPSERSTGQQEYADSWTADLDMNYGKYCRHSASANSLWHVCIDDVCVIRGPRPASHRQYLPRIHPRRRIKCSKSLQSH